MNVKERVSEIVLHSSYCKLNPKTQQYIHDVIKLLNHHSGIGAISSIILFGSQARDSGTEVSDCDLLIVVKDQTQSKTIQHLRRALLRLEIKYNFLDYRSTLLSSILFGIQRTTGMFVSHFITKRTYFRQALFYKIFNVNRAVCKLLAPDKLVLLSVVDNSTVIYGDDIRSAVNDELEGLTLTFSLIKSLLMNLAISIFSLALIPFKKLTPIKYSLEAIKWSLKSVHYYLFHTSRRLEEVLTITNPFISSRSKKKRAERFCKRFLDLRNHPQFDLWFMIQSPIKVFKIHLHALKRGAPD
jgi:predicted nucleotidyltransferase